MFLESDQIPGARLLEQPIEQPVESTVESTVESPVVESPVEELVKPPVEEPPVEGLVGRPVEKPVEQHSAFLTTLPLEVRWMIYEAVWEPMSPPFEPHERHECNRWTPISHMPAPPSSVPKPLLTCRQIFYEAYSIALKRFTFTGGAMCRTPGDPRMAESMDNLFGMLDSFSPILDIDLLRSIAIPLFGPPNCPVAVVVAMLARHMSNLRQVFLLSSPNINQRDFLICRDSVRGDLVEWGRQPWPNRFGGVFTRMPIERCMQHIKSDAAKSSIIAPPSNESSRIKFFLDRVDAGQELMPTHWRITDYGPGVEFSGLNKSNDLNHEGHAHHGQHIQGHGRSNRINGHGNALRKIDLWCMDWVSQSDGSSVSSS